MKFLSVLRYELSLTPNVLRWARERAGLDQRTLAKKLPVSQLWIMSSSGSRHADVLMFAQVGKLAHATHTPEGFLYLKEPPTFDRFAENLGFRI